MQTLALAYSCPRQFLSIIYLHRKTDFPFLLKYPEIQPITYQHNEQLGLAYQPTRYSLSPGNCSICCNMMHTHCSHSCMWDDFH